MNAELDANEWALQAVCATSDPDLWFVPEMQINLVKQAKKICNECPVQQQCLDYSIVNEVEYGVWGGLSARDRKKLYGSKQARQGNPQNLPSGIPSVGGSAGRTRPPVLVLPVATQIRETK